MEATIVLTPTTNALEGARGIARLKSIIVDGVADSTLRLKVRGLAAGEYLLALGTQSNETNSMTNILGQFTVAGGGTNDCDEHSRSRSHSHSDSDSGNSDDDSDGDIREQGHSHRGDTSRTDDDDDDEEGCTGDSSRPGDPTVVNLDLPSEINPLDITQITVSDMSSNVVLVGDLIFPNRATAFRFRGLVSVSAGEAAPSAKGKAHVAGIIRKGKTQTRFTMVASQVPADATFHLMVNGSDVGATVRSSRRGRVIVKKVPSQSFPVRSVELIDTAGNSAVSTSF